MNAVLNTPHTRTTAECGTCPASIASWISRAVASGAVASPRRSRPPRAVSSTATSTRGCMSTAAALRGPEQSPVRMRSPLMYVPSVQVMPTLKCAVSYIWASSRVTVVLPLVPVTARIGMRAGAPSG